MFFYIRRLKNALKVATGDSEQVKAELPASEKKLAEADGRERVVYELVVNEIPAEIDWMERDGIRGEESGTV